MWLNANIAVVCLYTDGAVWWRLILCKSYWQISSQNTESLPIWKHGVGQLAHTYERGIHTMHIAKLPTVNERKRDQQSVIEAKPRKRASKRWEQWKAKMKCQNRITNAWSPVASLAGGHTLLQIEAAGQTMRILYRVGKVVRIQLG